MDSKKVIEKLLSIAEKQQKIIQKLAQGTPVGSLGHEPPVQSLPAPNRPDFEEGQHFVEKLPPNLKPGAGIVWAVKVLPDEVHVRFEEGKDTDQNWNAFMAAVQAALPGRKVKTV